MKVFQCVFYSTIIIFAKFIHISFKIRIIIVFVLYQLTITSSNFLYHHHANLISPTDFYQIGKNYHKSESEVMRFDLRMVREADIVLCNLRDLHSSLGTSDMFHSVFASFNSVKLFNFPRMNIFYFWITIYKSNNGFTTYERL